MATEEEARQKENEARRIREENARKDRELQENVRKAEAEHSKFHRENS